MSSADTSSFGARIAQLRKDRGMTQEELATRVGRTASWLSQVERNVQPVTRLDVLQLLADALGVAMQALRPEVPLLPAAAPPIVQEGPNDLDGARLLLSGHPALNILLGDDSTPVAALSELQDAVDEVWELTHAARFIELSSRLTNVVPQLEQAARTLPVPERPEALRLLARTYQALAAAFVRQNEADAAWVAADRSIQAAEQSGQPLDVCAGIYRLAQAFVRLRRLDQAEHAARTAVEALNQVL